MNATTIYVLSTTEERTRYLSNNHGRLWLSTNVKTANTFRTFEAAEDVCGPASDVVGKELTVRALVNYWSEGVIA
jgi:hypothetical protein